MKKFLCYFLILLFLNNLAYASHLKRSSLVVDLNSGKVLHAVNEHSARYPASLVKMMTLYITFKKLSSGTLTLDQKLLVSKKAAAMPRTNMNLKAGTTISVRKAILGLIVHSSNDASVVLAEAIGGSEKNFVIMMNNQAKKLGMKKTIFYNASGWHNKYQKSTAYDLAKLAIALKKDFPKYFPWFSVTKFTFNNVTYHSHNHVVKNYAWANGLKTGFTNPSGFNVATTASKNGKHLVGVVMGEKTASARDKLMIKLLDNCFNKSQERTVIRTASLIQKQY
ncbi:MAG: D-alanyl-D-alanine carboxypeptidase family protein [Pseudomonadota bacterium]